MHLAAFAATFGVVFLGELPDKTMLASLVMSSRGHALAVWLGAATAFLVHVVIAVTIGAGIFNLLPDRVVEGVVAALFLFGAVYVLRSSSARETEDPDAMGSSVEAWSAGRTYGAAFGVVFVAEWGDLTQVITVNMAARYESPVSVGLGAVCALWAVAGIAVVGGKGLLRVLPVHVVQRITGVVLLVLAILTATAAIRG